MPGNLQHVSEPALVALQDGRLRLYFTAQRASAGPRAIFSALSTDGIHYQFEEGERFGFPDKDTSHASIFNYKGTLHLFSPLDKQGRAYHAVSKDGLNFTQLVNAMVQVPGVWIGNGLSLDQEMRFYGSGSEGIWMASSKEGGLWQLDESTQLLGTDPTIVLRKNKTYLAITAVPQGA
ncbi:MAG: hypothetical protein HYZ84_00075 [Candidatus Omnitrophica bacterium]|nr:hypothetical protein [Candidatus Omnitrophota bacterium]